MGNHYVLRFHTYSGMYYDMECDDDRKTVRSAAAKRIREARHAQPVHVLEPGERWEFETPESAFMIGDGDGIMTLVEVVQDDDEEAWLNPDHDDFDIEEFNAAYVVPDEDDLHLDHGPLTTSHSQEGETNT